MRHSICTLLLSVAIAACGTSVRYPADYPLSDNRLTIPGVRLTAMLPAGWQLADPGFHVGGARSPVIMTGGDGVSITFREITLDDPASNYYRRGRIAGLAALGRSLRDSGAVLSDTGITEFFYGGRRFAGYEYTGAAGPRRGVVFAAKERFFECEAFSARPLAGRSRYDSLFSALQSVLRSLR